MAVARSTQIKQRGDCRSIRQKGIEMYDTALGIRVLYGAEARLLAGAVWSLTDQLREFVSASDEQEFEHCIGIPILESLTAAQVIVLADRVSAFLLDSSIEAPTRTAILDATIAAIFQQVSENVQGEIYLESTSTEAEDGNTLIRTQVAEASEQTSDPQYPVLDTPDPECALMETWQEVIERLCDRVLPDSDWQLASIALDSDPSRSAAMKGKMGIENDYFIDTVPDASVEDAATAWCNTIQRITGWRPELWRFGGGLPMPADVALPPTRDLLRFSENEQAPTSPREVNRPGYQQTKPVLLSDVMFEIEGTTEEWSSFIDRKNGEVVGLPSQAIEFVEEGEDPDNGCGHGGEDFLELARKICGTDDFVSLPSQFDIHEWSIMRDFCNLVNSDSDRTELLEAVHGSGAFRFFKATINRLGLADQWYNFKEAAIERIVIEWLESQSIQWSRTKPGEIPF